MLPIFFYHSLKGAVLCLQLLLTHTVQLLMCSTKVTMQRSSDSTYFYPPIGMWVLVAMPDMMHKVVVNTAEVGQGKETLGITCSAVSSTIQFLLK